MNSNEIPNATLALLALKDRALELQADIRALEASKRKEGYQFVPYELAAASQYLGMVIKKLEDAESQATADAALNQGMAHFAEAVALVMGGRGHE